MLCSKQVLHRGRVSGAALSPRLRCAYLGLQICDLYEVITQHFHIRPKECIPDTISATPHKAVVLQSGAWQYNVWLTRRRSRMRRSAILAAAKVTHWQCKNNIFTRPKGIIPILIAETTDRTSLELIGTAPHHIGTAMVDLATPCHFTIKEFGGAPKGGV